MEAASLSWYSWSSPPSHTDLCCCWRQRNRTSLTFLLLASSLTALPARAWWPCPSYRQPTSKDWLLSHSGTTEDKAEDHSTVTVPVFSLLELVKSCVGIPLAEGSSWVTILQWHTEYILAAAAATAVATLQSFLLNTINQTHQKGIHDLI